MNDSRLPFWREGSRESGRSDGYGLAHSQSFATGSGRAWSGHCGQVANDERHSLGVAHGRAVARPARTIWQVEFGLRPFDTSQHSRIRRPSCCVLSHLKSAILIDRAPPKIIELPSSQSITSSGAGEQRGRNGEAERLRGFEIDNQLEFGRLLDGQVRRLRSLEDLAHVASGAPIQIRKVRSVGHEAAGLDIAPEVEDRWQPMLCREVREASSLKLEYGC